MNLFFDVAPEVNTSCSSSAKDSSRGMLCCGVFTPTTMAVSGFISFECNVLM